MIDCLAEDAGKDVRAAFYRLLRHLICDQEDLNTLFTLHFDLYLIKYVSRASSNRY